MTACPHRNPEFGTQCYGTLNVHYVGNKTALVCSNDTNHAYALVPLA